MKRSSGRPRVPGASIAVLCVALRAEPCAGGVMSCAPSSVSLLPCWVCPHVVIVQINAHSKLAVYFLKFNIVFVILEYLL